MSLVEFLMQHIILVGLLAFCLVGAAVISWMLRVPRGVALLDPDALVHSVNHQQAKLVDIRSKSEFEKGHIVGAISIPMEEWLQDKSVMNRFANKSVVLVCETGQKCLALVRNIIKQKPSATLGLLTGGMQAWREAALPLARDTSANQP